MHLFRAVDVTALARPAGHRAVNGKLLPRGAPAKGLQLQEAILDRGDDLFNAHHGYIDAGHAADHAPVAFIGDNADGAGFGDGEVAATDAHLRGEELLAQSGTRQRGHLRRFTRGGHVQLVLEDFGDILQPFVDDRGDDVAGRLIGQLDDILAQVRFDYAQADLFQGVVEVNLLGGHGFGF